MALVRGSRASANERLAQAISNFTNELPPEQREQLQDNRSRSPTMDDVMSLTAEIDLLATSRATEFRRCYGTRITSFLEKIQEVAKVADIAIGIAKSSTLSGVWVAIRFLLLAGTQAPNPYIDKLSALFLNLGRSAHRFRDMAILFPRSQNLQDAVFEYYIVVVDMCCEILKLSKKTNLARYWTAFAEESYTSKLDRCAKQIMQELVLESNRITVEESRRNSIFRAQSKEYMSLQKQHRHRVLRKRLLDACSKHDYRSTWKQTRDLGTTLLFNDSEAYREWKQSRKSCALFYHGKLGSGKSVLLANIVSDLHLQQESPRQVVYFFCRYDLPDSLLPRTIFGCIARQLLQYRPDLEELANSTDFSSYLSIEDISDLIKKSTSLPIYLVLDGIDACKSEHRDEVLRSLQHLQQHLVLNICVGTRGTSNQILVNEASWQHSLIANIPEPNPDMELYIEHKIDECLRIGKLIINDATLVAKVKMSLQAKAEGMFLWVYLQIVCLCLMESDYDIEQSLESLPSGLSETYSRLLKSQVTSQHRNRLFELIMVAREPLTTSQLQEALSIEAGNTDFNPKKLLNSIDRVIATTTGLVIIDEEEDTARFVHRSAVDFLTSPAYGSQIDLELASTRMTHYILTYLNYSLLETQLVLRVASRLTIEAVPAAILGSALPGARKIFKPTQSRNLQQKLADSAQSELIRRDRFLSYAQSFWLSHVIDTELDADYLSLLRSALDKGRMPVSVIRTSRTPLQDSVAAMRLDLVTFFLEYNPENGDKEEALRLATLYEGESDTLEYGPSNSSMKEASRILTAQDKNSAITKLLVGHCLHLKDEEMLILVIRYDSPTMWYALVNHNRTINGTKLNKEYKIRWETPETPLVASVLVFQSNKIGRMSKILLDEARVNPRKRSNGLLPIEYALSDGNIEGVRLLSKYYHHQEIGLEMERDLWMAALHRTPFRSGKNNAIIVDVLLRASCLTLTCHLDAEDLSPLMLACMWKKSDIIRVMLNYDSSNVNARTRIRNPTYERNFAESRAYRKYILGRNAWDCARSRKIRRLLEIYGGRGTGASIVRSLSSGSESDEELSV